MRKFGRIDATQREITAALRKAGCFVQSLANEGGGVPDLLVIKNGVVNLIECKDGNAPPSKQRLTEDESLWHRAALENGYRVRVCGSAEEALKWAK